MRDFIAVKPKYNHPPSSHSAGIINKESESNENGGWNPGELVAPLYEDESYLLPSTSPNRSNQQIAHRKKKNVVLVVESEDDNEASRLATSKYFIINYIEYIAI